MTPEDRQKRIEELFVGALELDPSERRAFLDKASGSDMSLRKEVEEYLREDAEAFGISKTG